MIGAGTNMRPSQVDEVAGAGGRMGRTLIRAIAANHTDPNAPGIAHQLGQLSGSW